MIDNYPILKKLHDREKRSIAVISIVVGFSIGFLTCFEIMKGSELSGRKISKTVRIYSENSKN